MVAPEGRASWRKVGKGCPAPTRYHPPHVRVTCQREGSFSWLCPNYGKGAEGARFLLKVQPPPPLSTCERLC